MSSPDPKKPHRERVLFDPSTPGRCPYRLLDERGEEVGPINHFLDAAFLRGLSDRTLRTYAFALLCVWQWITRRALSIEQLTEAHLLDFVGDGQQSLDSKRQLAPRSINLHLGVLEAFYRFHTGFSLPRRASQPSPPSPFFPRTRFAAFCHPRSSARPSFRVRVPQRLIRPLGRADVARFFDSLHSSRDLSLVSLMLFCGLRSREVLSLKLQDLSLLQQEIRVLGKGNKDRVLPLAPQARRALEAYLRLERPPTDHDSLFVTLKGKRRGHPFTPSGLREIFRYHRKRSGISHGNAHRFRHTFAHDMVRAGMSLPVLMRLMGHTRIEMTLRYVDLSADDVRDEFDKAIRRLTAPPDDGSSALGT